LVIAVGVGEAEGAVVDRLFGLAVLGIVGVGGRCYAVVVGEQVPGRIIAEADRL
jgi:hypothetical protein